MERISDPDTEKEFIVERFSLSYDEKGNMTEEYIEEPDSGYHKPEIWTVDSNEVEEEIAFILNNSECRFDKDGKWIVENEDEDYYKDFLVEVKAFNRSQLSERWQPPEDDWPYV